MKKEEEDGEIVAKWRRRTERLHISIGRCKMKKEEEDGEIVAK